MKLSERLDELTAQAESEGVTLDGLEVWETFGLVLAIGERLGLTRKEILGPVDEL